jgi:hypothetical protein
MVICLLEVLTEEFKSVSETTAQRNVCLVEVWLGRKASKGRKLLQQYQQLESKFSIYLLKNGRSGAGRS